ncbi:MAG TPA: 4-hydroxy-3-methylbut-2-enyl diphosphate reductase, partial [Bacteroidia bacterium]|nr:4-hydroxy-3-methylbut-2-enyl diphosphate reductase [Bacteroidia bacterium]
IVVREEADLEQIDFNRPVYFFSQTTKSTDGFRKMKEKIENRINVNAGETTEEVFEANDTLCRQVSNREPQLEKFATEHDVIVFVSGKKSSNGKVLFGVCNRVNPNSFFISDTDELKPEWFSRASSVGICGATSTPMWLMEKVADSLSVLNPN